MTNQLGLLLMFLAGGLLAIQAAINSRLGGFLESPIQAAFVSLASGAVGLAVLLLVMRQGLPGVSRLLAVHPVFLLGGLMGAAIVTATILSVPKFGIANVFLLALAGQITLSLIIDQYGWFGVRVISVDIWRVAGVILVIAGVALLNRQHWAGS